MTTTTPTPPTPDDLATPADDTLRVYEGQFTDGRESTPKQYGDPPLPAGATSVGDWHPESGTGREFRSFTGTERATGTEPDGRPVRVVIDGSQNRDNGSIERYVMIEGNICLDAAAARAHAGDLLAAADELDRLTD